MLMLTICYTLLIVTHAVIRGGERPNIILMMADDLGWGDIGANEPSNKNTPNIDQLAGEGIRYTDYHSAAPICGPSRAAMLTGRVGQRTGVLGNFQPNSIGGLPTSEILISEYLKGAGYTTGMIGKWHLGHNKPYNPTSRGFDYHFGLPYSNDMGCVFSEPIYFNKTNSSCPGSGKWPIGVPLYEHDKIIEQPVNLTTLSDRYVEKSKQFMTKALQSPAPFFLYMAFTHVHVPLAHNNNFTGKSSDGAFGDTLMELDDSVGRIVNFVKTNNISDNTVIIFTSDNGPWLYECNMAGSMGPYQGLWQREQGGGGSPGKMTTWEGGHRVPFIISWPGKLDVMVSDELVSGLDLLPTFAHLANFSLPTDRTFDGLVFPFVKPHEGLRTLVIQDKDLVEIWAIRYGHYKIFYGTRPDADCKGGRGTGFMYHNPALVFDLRTDPMESNNIFVDFDIYHNVEEIKNKMRKSIESDMKSVPNMADDPSAIPCCNSEYEYCSCTAPKDDEFKNVFNQLFSLWAA